MINTVEKIVARADFQTLRTAFIAAARRESGRIANTAQWLTDRGFERVAVAPDALLTADGREVLRLGDERWALLPEVHAARVKGAIAMSRSSQAVDTNEALGPACPKCGEPTNQTPVCPRCAIGKAGLKYQYACTCGVTFFTREIL